MPVPVPPAGPTFLERCWEESIRECLVHRVCPAFVADGSCFNLNLLAPLAFFLGNIEISEAIAQKPWQATGHVMGFSVKMTAPVQSFTSGGKDFVETYAHTQQSMLETLPE